MNPKILYAIEKMVASGNLGGAAILAGIGLIGWAVSAHSDKKINDEKSQ